MDNNTYLKQTPKRTQFFRNDGKDSFQMVFWKQTQQSKYEVVMGNKHKIPKVSLSCNKGHSQCTGSGCLDETN